jgi:hypothetical protein
MWLIGCLACEVEAHHILVEAQVYYIDGYIIVM